MKTEGHDFESKMQLSFFENPVSPKAIIDHELFSTVAPHIVKNFWTYHQENPKVFELFKRFANELRRVGRQRYGAKAVMERIRWHVAIETTGDEFKISNNHTSCYARLLMILDPQFEGFFELNRSSGMQN